MFKVRTGETIRYMECIIFIKCSSLSDCVDVPAKSVNLGINYVPATDIICLMQCTDSTALDQPDNPRSLM